MRACLPLSLLLAACLACPGPEDGTGTSRGAVSGESQADLTQDAAEMGMRADEAANDEGRELLVRARLPLFGDLPEIRQRRFLRVLVSYSKTNFFFREGRPRGFEVEMLGQYGDYLNRGSKSPLDTVRMLFVPTPFDRLLTDLKEGRGDIAAAGLTATDARKKGVAFTRPYLANVREVVVARRGLEGLDTLEDLAGREVVVRAGTSYVPHLRALSRRLEADGGPVLRVVEADRRLATEDLLELVNSGAIALTVADRHVADAWAEVLPDLVIRADLEIHSGGEIGWAVRQDADELLASLDQFVGEHRKGSLLGNILFRRYYENSRWIQNPLAETEMARLGMEAALFRKFGAQYGFDWLALAAQAFQESGLDHSRRSAAGAIGVMQLLPSTAADAAVGIPDIHLLENNIHAGAKYLAFLRDRYFDDPAIEPAARVDFAWAAYNVGPARIRRLRQKALERGFDPNRWFDNVERIAAEELGREPVDYVANINKYYLAYRLQYESDRARRAAKGER
jgi:membrane-bound lytic murein transglycosylase MltF